MHKHNISHKTTLKAFETNQHVWVKANLNYSGFYLVRYGPQIYSALVNILKTNASIITDTERTQLIYNMRILAKFGYESYVNFLEFLLYVNPNAFDTNDTDLNEKGTLPLLEVLESIKDLYNQFRYYNNSTLFADLMRSFINRLLLDKLLERFDPWKSAEEVSRADLTLQAKTIEMAVMLGHEPTITKCRSLFRNWMDNYTTTNRTTAYPESFGAIVKAGIQYGNTKDWDDSWALYKISLVPFEKRALLSALATTNNSTLMERLLGYIKNGLLCRNKKDSIKPQNSIVLLSWISGRSPLQGAQNRVWEFVKKEWNLFLRKFGKNSLVFDMLIDNVCKGFGTKELLSDYETFFKGPLARGLITEKAFYQTREHIITNIKSVKLNYEAIMGWLENHNV